MRNGTLKPIVTARPAWVSVPLTNAVDSEQINSRERVGEAAARQPVIVSQETVVLV
jgi:hypothetical protein